VPAHLVAYVLDFLVAFAGAAAVYGYWLANRRRLSAETLGRAEEQARAIVREAEREGDTRRKEALLDAKERAHDLRVEAEQFARDTLKRGAFDYVTKPVNVSHLTEVLRSAVRRAAK